MSHQSMIQLDPTIPVVTPDGKGEAIGWIDYSKDDDLLWIVFLQKNGECWIYQNSLIRACPNVTAGRMPGIGTREVKQNILNGIHAQGKSARNKKHPVITPFDGILEKTGGAKGKASLHRAG